MVWRFPPERAGRAPHASRHSNSAEVAPVKLALVADVAAGLGTGGGFAPVSGAGTASLRVVLEQALTMDATPTLPARLSS